MEDQREKTAPYVRGAVPEVQDAALRMRWSPTPAEAALWSALKGRQLNGWKFRRQHPVGPFVIDFYCPAARLAVELDGSIHLTPEQQIRDVARTEQLASYGIRVVRFSNTAVMNDLPDVLTTLAEMLG